MARNREPDDEAVDAGALAPWLATTRAAIRGERDADVPCDGCTACCRASQFVHVDPDETDALAHIPPELLFPAPGLPRGHVLLGYDERGHCPMLVDGRCSIYPHRPRACRTYDCRVFAATEVEPEGREKAEVARRVRTWRFEVATDDDRARRRALRSAVAALRSDGVADPTELAVRAVEMHESFL